MRFLCDAMLGRLARWLRAAGHDTRLADEADDDRHLLEIAVREGRILLTLDRRLAGRKAGAGRVVLLHSESVAEQAGELRRGLGVDWLRDPFSRCVVDNTPLRPAGAEQVATLPEKVRALGGPVAECPHCHRLYWPGDHHRRMRERLESWQQGGGA
jgi:uncharacterized protein with PIN domain